MNPFRYKVSLRFFDGVVAPEEIADRLALQPRISHKMGQPRRTPRGDPLTGSYSKHYCLFELAHGADEPLEEMLSRAVAELTPMKDLFLRVTDSGGSVEFFVGWFSPRNSGATLGHQLLKRLGQLRLDLALDVYAEVDDSPSTDEA